MRNALGIERYSPAYGNLQLKRTKEGTRISANDINVACSWLLVCITEIDLESSSTKGEGANAYEPPREKKPTKWHVRPAKTQMSLGIHPV